MPNTKMERFTPRAQHVLSLTQAEAERMGHGSIDTEHLLLGMLREDGGVAGRVLRDLGVERSRAAELIAELSQASAQSTGETLNLSRGTKRVLELAVDEARRMGRHSIGTEHMLLALVRQPEGMAIDVLKRLGISAEEIRRQTRRVLQQERTQAEQPSPLFQLEFIERFGQRAKFALSLTLDYAEQMQHGQIDSGHLLVGLMREESGVAGQVLRDLGLEQKQVEAAVKELTLATTRASNQVLDLSPDLKRVLEMAVQEARRIPSSEVGTEALLLALVRHEENGAIEVLKRLGISPEDVQRQIFRTLQKQPHQDMQRPSSARKREPTNPMLYIRVIDDETGMGKSNFALPFGILNDMFQAVRSMVNQGEMNKFALFDKDRAQRLEINFDEDVPPSAESGDSDAQ